MKKYLLLLILWTQVTLAQQQSKLGESKLSKGPERRLALVIGMSNYQSIRPLQNPPNDADDMEAVLKQLGFTIINIKNQDLGYVKAKLDLFINSLRPNDIVFVYFSGHGIGYNGDNFLLPVDARLECLEEISSFGISVNSLQAAFRGRKVRNNFLVLDACRSLDKSIYSCEAFGKTAVTTKGLVIPQNQLEGDVIVYATQQGENADDNVQQHNGLFTQVLMKYLVIPDLSFYQIIAKTTKEVRDESLLRVKQKQMTTCQLPAMYGNLGLEFVFIQSSSSTKIKSMFEPLRLPSMDELVGEYEVGNRDHLLEYGYKNVKISKKSPNQYELSFDWRIHNTIEDVIGTIRSCSQDSFFFEGTLNQRSSR